MGALGIWFSWLVFAAIAFIPHSSSHSPSNHKFSNFNHKYFQNFDKWRPKNKYFQIFNHKFSKIKKYIFTRARSIAEIEISRLTQPINQICALIFWFSHLEFQISTRSHNFYLTISNSALNILVFKHNSSQPQLDRPENRILVTTNSNNRVYSPASPITDRN